MAKGVVNVVVSPSPDQPVVEVRAVWKCTEPGCGEEHRHLLAFVDRDLAETDAGRILLVDFATKLAAVFVTEMLEGEPVGPPEVYYGGKHATH